MQQLSKISTTLKPRYQVSKYIIYKRKSAFLLLATIPLFGCTTQHAPQIAYEQMQPLANTSVFMAMNQSNGNIQARVKNTDGKEMPCLTAGCPYWVRVLPGNHKFVLDYRVNFSLNMGAIEWQQAEIEIDVPDMKPKHVYQAKYQIESGKVKVQIVDHGENPDIGLDFSYMGYHKARFTD